MAHIVKVVEPPHSCLMAIVAIDSMHLGKGSIASCCGKLYIKTDAVIRQWRPHIPNFPGETDDAH